MFKKITKLACLSCVAFSASLIADNNMNSSNNTSSNDGVEIFDGGFTLGTSVNYSTTGISPFLTFGYINDWFLFDAGFNFNNISLDDDDDSRNYAEFMGHLGMRAQAYGNLYVTFGATGGTVAGKVNDHSRPWNVGAFIGLDLQATKHFLISAKINPYTYQHVATDFNVNEVFSAGSLNFSYVF